LLSKGKQKTKMTTLMCRAAEKTLVKLGELKFATTNAMI
jgi:hypothetical protein